MDGATLLRNARNAHGLSQRALSRRSGVPQPNLSDIENGHADVTVSRLNRVLRALASQLTVLPTSAPSIADWVTQISHDLCSGDTAAARTVFVRVADSFSAQEPAVRVALSVQPPPSTGDAGFDAAVAGLVDYLLGRAGLPVPYWVADVPSAPDPLYLVPTKALRDLVKASTPAPFRSRNVYVPEEFFESV